ncbi:MAG TPA: hypothetical protein VIF82_13905 [Burkholderiaceae bacterium]|jgi:hypothetical protein
MAIINAQRNAMIRHTVMRQTEVNRDDIIQLWERLANELISIIGEGGFQSLYARSLHLTSATYPWLMPNQPWQQGESRFADLHKSLVSHDLAQATEASIVLLTTFIDILATLIGEQLTTNMLRSAWGGDALDTAAKELEK